MRITIETDVAAPLESVFDQFNEQLFIALAPTFPKIALKRFDGSKKGDVVALELNFLLFKQAWVSKITKDELSKNSWHFVDVGVEVPFFLKEWTHKHVVNRLENGNSQIIDDITYSSGLKILDLILYPVFKAQFAARGPIYKSYFK